MQWNPQLSPVHDVLHEKICILTRWTPFCLAGKCDWLQVIVPAVITSRRLLSPSSSGEMDLDEEILAKGPPSRIINACGDGSLLADYSCSNPPVPLCHSTPIDSTKSELKVVTDAGKSGEGSIFNTAPLCCGKKYFLVEEQNEESMEEEVHGLVELSDDSIQSDNDLSSELKKSDETETETEEKDSKEPALELDEPSGSTQRYWFRERKPKSKKFGIVSF